MKTVKNKSTLLVLAVMLCMKSFGLNGGSTMETVRANVQKEIQTNVHVTVKHSQKVEVLFTTDNLGKVNLAIAKTANQELRKAIEANFLKLRIKNLAPDNCYSIELSFKLL